VSERLRSSPAVERNREPLLARLRPLFDARPLQVLEIGSGTGQHAVFFARHLPQVRWQTSDLPGNHALIRAWIEAEGSGNVLPPLTLDADDLREAPAADVWFTANTLHIMSWPSAQRLIAGAGRHLPAGGRLLIYGPFNVGGRFTSASNREFDASLRRGDPHSGLRDREAVCRCADAAGLSLEAAMAMPANNQLLVFGRRRERLPS
jgi:SAM-dependent methyltransferase